MKARKRPVVVEVIPVHEVLNAAKLRGGDPGELAPWERLPIWLQDACHQLVIKVHDHAVEIATLAGTMYGMPGDWIIQGVAGEIYPCKPDIFDKTYVAVSDGDEIIVETTETGARPQGLFDNSLGEIARDCNRDVTIPRTLVRRTISDMEYLVGWAEAVTAGIVASAKTPEQRAAFGYGASRIAGAAGRIRQLYTCGGITEDEDLDD